MTLAVAVAVAVPGRAASGGLSGPVALGPGLPRLSPPAARAGTSTPRWGASPARGRGRTPVLTGATRRWRTDHRGDGGDVGNRRPDGHVEVALEALDRTRLVRRDEADHHAGGAGPRRPTGTVHVVLGVGRWVEVHHGIDPVHVDAPGGHVGGHQSVDRTPDEQVERLLPLLLAAVTVDGGGTHTPQLQLPGDPVGAVLGPAEDDGRTGGGGHISGPIDPRISPTKVNRFALEHSLAWLEATLIYRVPPPARGYGRRVYPGALQLQAFVSLDVARHVEAHCKHFLDVAVGNGSGEAAGKHRKFYDEYFAVIDLPAEFYLQTVAEVFQEHTLPKGTMLHRGIRVQPEAITRTALLTVEGAKDDITGLGQTQAAHTLCRALPEAKKTHHVQEGVGHYGTFSGRKWREEIAPIVKRFIQTHDA